MYKPVKNAQITNEGSRAEETRVLLIFLPVIVRRPKRKLCRRGVLKNNHIVQCPDETAHGNSRRDKSDAQLQV
jgi:hypothetical protein